MKQKLIFVKMSITNRNKIYEFASCDDTLLWQLVIPSYFNQRPFI